MSSHQPPSGRQDDLTWPEITLSARALSCERDDRELFHDLSFDISSGDVVQLVGQNGAGKTTLLRILAGLNRDHDGEVLFQQSKITAVYPEYAQQRLYQGHLSAIKKTLTPLENLRWLMSMHGGCEERTLWQALEQVSLNGYEDVPCGQLSAGQQRRVALARLLIAPCPIWVLDEPFTALDTLGVAWLEALLVQHVARNGIVVITSHHALSSLSDVKRIELGIRSPEQNSPTPSITTSRQDTA